MFVVVHARTTDQFWFFLMEIDITLQLFILKQFMKPILGAKPNFTGAEQRAKACYE